MTSSHRNRVCGGCHFSRKKSCLWIAATSSSFHFCASHSLEHHWYQSTLLLLGIVPHHTVLQPTVRLECLLPPLARLHLLPLPLLPLPHLRLPTSACYTRLHPGLASFQHKVFSFECALSGETPLACHWSSSFFCS